MGLYRRQFSAKGTMNEDFLMKAVGGYNRREDVPKKHTLHEWVYTEDNLVHTFEGQFDMHTKLLTIADVHYTGHESNMKKWFLVLHEDRLIGVQQSLNLRPDLTDPNATEPINLLCIR